MRAFDPERQLQLRISLFAVAPGSTEPIYHQLVAQVRRCVAGGQLRGPR